MAPWPCCTDATKIQDNNSIYYELVPAPDTLEPLPEPVVMMKVIPSQEEAAPTGLLSFKGTGTKTTPAEGSEKEASASEAGKKTDEELARELHDKLNSS